MLRLISSMAVRQVLAELTQSWQQATGVEVCIESVGGVDAAKRVQAGEAFDGVVLASDAIDKLASGGRVFAGSRVDLVRSSVAVAVMSGAPRPDIGTEAALRRAIDAAPSIGYSTGPSGVALLNLFERWGVIDALASRIVQAPPGVPVGALVARGDVALGFQQLSELIHLEGIDVLGKLPEAVGMTTVFSAGICANSMQGELLSGLLVFMASDDTAAVKRRHGLEPATMTDAK